MFVHSKAVVCPFAHQPGDVFAATQHPLALFLQEGIFAVGQIIAYFFAPFHAEGHERVARLPQAQGQCVVQLGGVETGGEAVAGDDEVGRQLHFRHFQSGRAVHGLLVLHQQQVAVLYHQPAFRFEGLACLPVERAEDVVRLCFVEAQRVEDFMEQRLRLCFLEQGGYADAFGAEHPFPGFGYTYII